MASRRRAESCAVSIDRSAAGAWSGTNAGSLGIEFRTAVTPDRVDSLVARDGEYPGGRSGLRRIERVGPAPDHQHHFLNQFIRLRRRNAGTQQISLQPGSYPAKQQTESRPVPVTRDGDHEIVERSAIRDGQGRDIGHVPIEGEDFRQNKPGDEPG